MKKIAFWILCSVVLTLLGVHVYNQHRVKQLQEQFDKIESEMILLEKRVKEI